MTFMWILVAILWTIVILILGVYIGMNWPDDEKSEVAPDENVMSMDVDTSRFDSEIQAVKAKLEALMGHQHPTPKCDHAKKVDELSTKVDDLSSTVDGYGARFTRVEKRAGLSV